MKFSKNAKRCFASSVAVSLLLAGGSILTVTGACAKSQEQLADDTLLVVLAPHADRTTAQAHLLNEAQANTIEDLHVNGEDYSILHVQPPKGQREATRNNILGMMKNHPEIKSVSRNVMVHRFFNHHWPPPPPPPPKPPSPPPPPPPVGSGVDPDLSQQWPLAAMRWTAAQSQYSGQQKQSATITLLSTGVNPVATDNELGAYITQYNCTKTPIKTEALRGYSAEGDIDASITGALTNNGELIAGSGCFAKATPCKITMLRITSNDSASLSNIESAIVFAINNQALRGGPGPVSLSFGMGFPDAPLWSSTYGLQPLAQTLVNQGDILVLSAGDSKGTYGIGTASYPPGAIVVAQGTDSNNNFYSSDPYSGSGLTLVLGDPVGAPGAVQPAIISGAYADDYFGSSFSAPLWSSAIAMLISMNPNLTSAAAHQILLNTGTPITGGYPSGSTWSAVVPAFDRAIQAAVGH